MLRFLTEPAGKSLNAVWNIKVLLNKIKVLAAKKTACKEAATLPHGIQRIPNLGNFQT